MFALLVVSCGGNTSTRQYDPSAVKFKASYNSYFENCIYPSFILALSSYQGSDKQTSSLFTVEVTNPVKDAVLRVVIDSTQLSYTTVFQEVMQERNAHYIFSPQIKWKYPVLYNVRQQGAVDFTFTCYINDEEVDVKNVRLNYRSANECLLALNDSAGKSIDIRWIFAGYVNEDHPYIDTILTRVIDNNIINRFVGYQQGEKMVKEQVFAFWYDALERGITYSSISCTSNPSKRANVQRIRFFDQVYNSRQANCVDACVFFASLLRKVGLKPVIFIEPCHAYLGCYLNRNKSNILLLETTITSWVNFPALAKSLDENGRLSDKEYNKIKKYLSTSQQNAYASGKLSFDQLKIAVARSLFDRAVNYKVESYNQNKALFNDPDNTSYQQLDIEQLRRMVQPIN